MLLNYQEHETAWWLKMDEKIYIYIINIESPQLTQGGGNAMIGGGEEKWRIQDCSLLENIEHFMASTY